MTFPQSVTRVVHLIVDAYRDVPASMIKELRLAS
jgi:hypothetical protein